MADYEPNLFSGVDTRGVGDMGQYEVFQAGKYSAIMIGAVRKANGEKSKDPTGSHIECVYQIIEGQYSGKNYTSRINLWNQNVTAVEIARKEIGALRKALGLSETEGDTMKYLNRPLILNLKVENRKVNGSPTAELQNQLVSIEPYSKIVHDQKAPPYQGQPIYPNQNPQPEATRSTTPPWQRK